MYRKGYQTGYHEGWFETKERLKADMVAMLTELQLEIEEKAIDLCDAGWYLTYNYIIQQKINALKGNEDAGE